MRLFTLLTKSSIFLTEKLAPDPEKYEINFAFQRGHIQGSPDTTGLGLLCAGVSAIYEITAAHRCCPERVCGGHRGGDTFLAPSVNGQVRAAEDVSLGADPFPGCFVSVKIKVLCAIDRNLKGLF